MIQVQTTILPTIGQFGGDEFERAKAIYSYLKSKGATNQAIAAILGNWSVESSINPKRAEGDYLSPPVGATDSSWDDEAGSHSMVQPYTMDVTQIFSNVV